MTKLSLAATAVASAITLAGCNLFYQPSETDLARCAVVGAYPYPTDTPLEALVGWTESRGGSARWGRSGPDRITLAIDKANERTGEPLHLEFDVELIDKAGKQQHCGPGLAVFRSARFNDEPGNLALIDGIISAAGEYYRARLKEQPAAPAPEPVLPPTPSPSVQNEMSLDEEAEADSDYYAQQADTAAKRPLSLVDRSGNRFCCWTVERLIRRMTERGAKARIDTADSGIVWVTIDDPARRWNGWSVIEFEMRNTPAIPDGLIITSIKADDRVVASLREGDTTPEDVLQPILPLR